ncbi:ribonuclease H-like domain-containing protein [Aminipila butyrica]|uniref:Ribonuclease H-like domain-containing protein n=1 Tax=Aminipila butyrica TaxID=433296 RepID=A0A858BUI8_9FIRM|nr:ribonuclease H-like domain-containing protein [Aminipila butyrica]QIB68859.1 ribonuclease H-like domain-containing protein [Aminipila butyrica]
MDPKYIQYHSRLLDFYLGSAMHKKIGVLDIETTGLSPQNSHFILGGLLIYQEEGVTLRQYFAESLEEERETLLAYLRDIQQLDILITYNGKHFDLKFLQGRMRALSLWEDFIFPFNLDLYLLINGHSSLRKLLPNLKQKTVENFMGLWGDRADEISGAESVELYKRFLYTKDPEIRRLIMLHNSDDVLQLSQLLPVTEKSDIHKAFFSLGFPVEDLHVSKIAFHSGNLQICGSQQNPLTYAAYQLDDCSCSLDFDRYSEEFSMELPIIKRSGLMIADTRVFDKDFSALQKYDTYDSGFLVLKQGDTVHYRETNHFVKLITERVREVLPI